MKMYLVDVENEKIGAIDIEPELDEYYRVLCCDTIDVATRSVGGKYFDIICDDEGLLKDRPKISLVDKHGKAMLVGNLLFCHHDENGETVGLEESELAFLSRNTRWIYTGFYPDGYPAVVNGDI